MKLNRKSAALFLFSIGLCANAPAKSVEQLKNSGDLRGLVAKLGDKQASVRRDASLALPGVAERVRDPAVLDSVILRLLDARMRDPWQSTREYSGRALMYALNKTENQALLQSCIEPLLDALDRGQVEVGRRRYASVALAVVMIKLERVDRMQPRMRELVASALADPDEGVRKYSQRALQHTLQKLDDEPALTIAARPLAERLGEKDRNARSYSAVMLSSIVSKIKDPGTLKRLHDPIRTAATTDSDRRVREYAGRALRSVQSRLKQREAKPVSKGASAPSRNAAKQTTGIQ